MARNYTIRLSVLAAACATIGMAEAQSYYSPDDLFCSPDYHSLSDFTFSNGAGGGKVSIQDLHFTGRKQASKDPVDYLFDFGFDGVASWSWGLSQSGSVHTGSGSGKCVMATHYLGTDSSGADSWSTELVSMGVTFDDPSDGSSLMLRESPTLASTGQTTIKGTTKPKGILNPFVSSGAFEVNSFFDVFTEVSLDQGVSWTPSDASARLQGTPEPASIAAMGVGFAALLRRRAKKAQ